MIASLLASSCHGHAELLRLIGDPLASADTGPAMPLPSRSSRRAVSFGGARARRGGAAALSPGGNFGRRPNGVPAAGVAQRGAGVGG